MSKTEEYMLVRVVSLEGLRLGPSEREQFSNSQDFNLLDVLLDVKYQVTECRFHEGEGKKNRGRGKLMIRDFEKSREFRIKIKKGGVLV